LFIRPRRQSSCQNTARLRSRCQSSTSRPSTSCSARPLASASLNTLWKSQSPTRQSSRRRADIEVLLQQTAASLAEAAKVAEKNAFSGPHRAQLKPSRHILPKRDIRRICGHLATFVAKRYGDPNLAGGARGTGIEPSPLCQVRIREQSQWLRLQKKGRLQRAAIATAAFRSPSEMLSNPFGLYVRA
jgi:hypothetical protein